MTSQFQFITTALPAKLGLDSMYLLDTSSTQILPQHKCCPSIDATLAQMIFAKKIVYQIYLPILFIQVQLVGSPAPPLTNSIMSSEEMGMAMTSVNSQQEKNSIVAITNDNTSSAGSIHGRPPEGADDLPAGSTVKSSSSRPCCFCWCCCCSCSW